MSQTQIIEQNSQSFLEKIISMIKKVKPIHIISVTIPFVLFYPKPIIKIIKPIINRWTYYYRQINQQTNQPVEIILSTNPIICFKKQFINKISSIKGQLPESFKSIKKSTQKYINLAHNNFDDQTSMKKIIYQQKYLIEQNQIYDSCFIINCFEKSINKFDEIQKHKSKLSTKSMLKHKLDLSSISQRQSDQITQSNFNQQINDNELNHQQNKFIDHLWVEIILLNLKMINLERNGKKINHILIKANQNILKMLQSSILGISFNQSFKLGSYSQNKLHILKFNKKLKTYELCKTTFEIKEGEY